MISIKDLKKIARSRYEESTILFKAHRYDGSVYLCGYSIEIALKSKVCQSYGLTGFPESNQEFITIQNQFGIYLKTHNLDSLLMWTGVELSIKSNFLSEWSIIANWDPEVRYKPIGSATMIDAKNMIDSVATIRGNL